MSNTPERYIPNWGTVYSVMRDLEEAHTRLDQLQATLDSLVLHVGRGDFNVIETATGKIVTWPKGAPAQEPTP